VIEGVFHLRARVEGNDVGYDTIAASGSNATVLHWMRNTGAVRRGDLLLLDAGVECTTSTPRRHEDASDQREILPGAAPHLRSRRHRSAGRHRRGQAGATFKAPTSGDEDPRSWSL